MDETRLNPLSWDPQLTAKRSFKTPRRIGRINHMRSVSSGPISRRLSPTRARESYTHHLRQSSCTSTDGVPQLQPLAQPEPRLDRPRSTISLPDHVLLNRDRWNYDHERMPSRPQTPTSPYRPPTPRERPRSALLSVPVSTGEFQGHKRSYSHEVIRDRPKTYHYGEQPWISSQTLAHDGSTTSLAGLRMKERPRSDIFPASLRPDEYRPASSHDVIWEQPLSRENMWIPPRIPIPGESTPAPSTESEANGILSKEKPVTRLHPAGDEWINSETYAQPVGPRASLGDRKQMPGCCGVCELSTAKFAGGKLTVWLTGTLMPILFSVVRECLTHSCK